MQERTINGTRVVFRDKFPGPFGWALIGPMNRLSAVFEKRRKEIREEINDPELPDDAVLIPGEEATTIIGDTLSWETVVLMVRGAVLEWDFDGDLSKDTCCDNLDTLSELFPIIVRARQLYFGTDLSGE